MYHDDYLQTAQQMKDSQLGQQQCGVQADPNYNPPGEMIAIFVKRRATTSRRTPNKPRSVPSITSARLRRHSKPPISSARILSSKNSSSSSAAVPCNCDIGHMRNNGILTAQTPAT